MSGSLVRAEEGERERARRREAGGGQAVGLPHLGFSTDAACSPLESQEFFRKSNFDRSQFKYIEFVFIHTLATAIEVSKKSAHP
jgi:hypothetical protein